MKRQFLLCLATQVHDTPNMKLKTKDMLIFTSEMSLTIGMEKAIKQKKVLILRVIRHYY